MHVAERERPGAPFRPDASMHAAHLPSCALLRVRRSYGP